MHQYAPKCVCETERMRAKERERHKMYTRKKNSVYTERGERERARVRCQKACLSSSLLRLELFCGVRRMLVLQCHELF